MQKKYLDVSRDYYVKLNDKVVTAIQTIGEYDHITRREFDTEKEAEDFFDRLTGKAKQ